MEEKPEPQTLYSGPNTQPLVNKRRAIGVLAALLVIFLAIATGYLLFIKNVQSSFVASKKSSELEWEEYQSEAGFTFSYPQGTELSETEAGISLANSISFVVGDMKGESLRAIVGQENTETYTVDSRTGYKVASEGKTFYYFPLFNDHYLEAIDGGNGQEIVAKLKFVAPQSASAN